MANEKILTLNEALKIAEKKGVTMSRNGLRTVAIRNGIISEAIGEGREKNLLDAAKFGEWVVKVARKPPANFATIAAASKELGLSNTRVFKLIKEHKVTHDFYGLGKTIYFDLEALQEKIVGAKAEKVKKAEAKTAKPKREKKEKPDISPDAETEDEGPIPEEPEAGSRGNETGDITDPLGDEMLDDEPTASAGDDVDETDEDDFDDEDEDFDNDSDDDDEDDDFSSEEDE